MKTECSHCGHGFEATDSLAACPKCEQIFEPTNASPRIFRPPQPNEHRPLKFWGGLSCIAIGLVGAPFLIGIPVLIFGCYLTKSADGFKK